MWSNDIKCEYMFMFPLKRLACKGLTWSWVWFSISISTLPWYSQTFTIINTAVTYWITLSYQRVSPQLNIPAKYEWKYIYLHVTGLSTKSGIPLHGKINILSFRETGSWFLKGVEYIAHIDMVFEISTYFPGAIHAIACRQKQEIT